MVNPKGRKPLYGAPLIRRMISLPAETYRKVVSHSRRIATESDTHPNTSGSLRVLLERGIAVYEREEGEL